MLRFQVLLEPAMPESARNIRDADAIHPDALLRGAEVDRLLAICPSTRKQLIRNGALVRHYPAGPRSHPRFLAREVFALRDGSRRPIPKITEPNDE